MRPKQLTSKTRALNYAFKRLSQTKKDYHYNINLLDIVESEKDKRFISETLKRIKEEMELSETVYYFLMAEKEPERQKTLFEKPNNKPLFQK